MAQARRDGGNGDPSDPVHAAVAAAGDLVCAWDLDGDGVRWHGAVTAVFGQHADSPPATGEDLIARIHPEDVGRRQQSMDAHLSNGALHDCEYRLDTGDGIYHWVHERGAAQQGQAGTTLLATLRLVDDRKAMEARLEYFANYDDLTGHFNKHRLRQALDQALAEAGRFGTTGAFAVVGIDQLAMINTAYGPETGDAVLVRVGERLDASLRAADVIGRIGGDRLGVVLMRCDENEAMRVAERAVADIRRTPIDTPSGPLRVTVSAGVVVFPTQSHSSYDLMAKADSALHQAKNMGRNCAGFYQLTEEQRRAYQISLDTGAEVQEALKEGRITFAYQPVVRARSHDVQFYECLLRLQRRDGEILTAGRFVPVIEQLGLMRSLDRRVLDLAVDQLRAQPDIMLAINISALTAGDRSWLRALISKLKGRPDVARRLIVEITETTALKDLDETAFFAETVRELGCKLALDDFGAGFTTFRHLKSLTVDVVKIDGSFVRNIAVEPQNKLFVRNLVGLARSLELAVVGECTENAEEARILADEGVDLLQGFYFGRPSVERPWAVPADGSATMTPALGAHSGDPQPG
ncbi:diguanylate cyclase/phosphodiesterase [Limimonas halophila]|uniref:Diguanylate cyclase/phosphodiesterase n=1 Tax=Limimonas halophila TaxID=1082479 RepID=A0A1G7UVA9_9PROT|nr:EAL domain-containing protein [Limimonas halophila]SDG51535.1 diguanylate cyclase/phosphodiesterase [Limimonas halophila]